MDLDHQNQVELFQIHDTHSIKSRGIIFSSNYLRTSGSAFHRQARRSRLCREAVGPRVHQQVHVDGDRDQRVQERAHIARRCRGEKQTHPNHRGIS